MDTGDPDGRLLRLRMFAPVGSHPLGSNLAPFMGQLRDLLGEHEVGVSAMSLDPSAWESALPWRQVEHGFGLRVSISELAQASVADQISRHAKSNPSFWVSRGGGSSRTDVWHFSNGELCIRTRFLPPHECERVDALIRSFFELGSDGCQVTHGTGELVDYTTETRYPRVRLGWSFETWLAEALEREIHPVRPQPLGSPRWITLLAWDQLEAMGGLERVARSLAEFDRVMSRARETTPWRVFPEAFPHAVRVRHGLLVRLAPTHALMDWECGQSCFARGHFEAIAAAKWLLHELHEAGLLVLPSTNWLKDEELLIEREGREAAAREAARVQSKTRRTTPTRKAAMSAPRCIRGVGRPVRSDGQGGHGGEACTFLVLPAHLGGEAMTVYGRRGAGNELMQSPVLVGSIKPERAALFFDVREHGWDGEHAEQSPESARPLGRLTQLVCPGCKGRLFRAFATFERNDEPYEASELRPGSTGDDLFTWFSLHAECAGCSERIEVAEIECA